MRSEDQQDLMSALTQSIVAGLAGSGARITSETGDDAGGYKFKYTEGKSAGTIVLRPVKQLDPDRLHEYVSGGKKTLQFLNPGEVPVEVVMSIEETWR